MRGLIVLAVLLIGTAAYAGGIDTMIVPPAESPRAGQSMVFSVYFSNPEDAPLTIALPKSMTCRLSAGDKTVEVPAHRVRETAEKTMIVCPGCFKKIQYSLEIPSLIEGTVSMEVPQFKTAQVMFAVQSGSPLKKSTESESESGKFPTLDSLFELYQPYIKNLSAYDPMYFLVGTDPKQSKFQISFKYRLFDPNSELVRDHPWTEGFHLAYTQTSFWDLRSASQPFEDTSYKPEFFFLSPNLKVSWATGLFIKTGFQHESNGRGGDLSRSTNFLYVKPIYIHYWPKHKLGLLISPKIWTYLINDDVNNLDLNDYRGYFDLEIKGGQADGFVLGSHFRYAKEGGSVELNLTYPLSQFIFKNLNLYFQIQYVNALAESLLYYKERTDALRIGFAIVR